MNKVENSARSNLKFEQLETHNDVERRNPKFAVRDSHGFTIGILEWRKDKNQYCLLVEGGYILTGLELFEIAKFCKELTEQKRGNSSFSKGITGFSPLKKSL